MFFFGALADSHSSACARAPAARAAQALQESQLANFARLQQQQQAQFTQWQHMQLVQQQMAMQRQLCESAPAALCSNIVSRMLAPGAFAHDTQTASTAPAPSPVVAVSTVPCAAAAHAPRCRPAGAPVEHLPHRSVPQVPGGALSAAGASCAAACELARVAGAPLEFGKGRGRGKATHASLGASTPGEQREHAARGSSKINMASAAARFKVVERMNDARMSDARAAMRRAPPPANELGDGAYSALAPRRDGDDEAIGTSSAYAAHPALSARKGSGHGCSGAHANADGGARARARSGFGDGGGACSGLGSRVSPPVSLDDRGSGDGSGDSLRIISLGGSRAGSPDGSPDVAASLAPVGSDGGSSLADSTGREPIDDASVWSWLNNDDVASMMDGELADVGGVSTKGEASKPTHARGAARRGHAAAAAGGAPSGGGDKAKDDAAQLDRSEWRFGSDDG